MGTPYSLIYKRAITEFKDPTLNQLLNNNSILFFEVMYNYLENAIQLFTNPVDSQNKLNDSSLPFMEEQNFNCNGLNNTFVLDKYPQEEQYDEVIFECKIGSDNIDYEYSKESHQIILKYAPQSEQVLNVQWYFAGSFNAELNQEEIYILSQFILACWSEYIYNDKLDVIRLLGDTDFKLPANGTTTTSKMNWNIVNRETVTKRMNNYAWRYNLGKWGDKY